MNQDIQKKLEEAAFSAQPSKEVWRARCCCTHDLLHGYKNGYLDGARLGFEMGVQEAARVAEERGSILSYSVIGESVRSLGQVIGDRIRETLLKSASSAEMDKEKK